MKVQIDNFGTRCVYREGRKYYLRPDGRMMVQWFSHSTDKQGRIWQTPHVRVTHSKFGARIRAALEGKQK